MKLNIAKTVSFWFIIIINLGLLHSQITTNELPVSFTKSALSSPGKVVCITPPDMIKIHAEDANNDTIPGILTRVAVAIPVKIDPESFGEWEPLPEGGLLWRLTLSIKDAQSLDLTFDEFWLPDQGKFYVYSPETKNTIGAITSEFLRGSKENPADFSTGIIYGDKLTLEYYQPSHVKGKPIIKVSNIYYGYRYVKKYSETKSFGDSGDCQVNVNCSEGQNWQAEKKAVARIYVKMPNKAGWCSGALVNNTANNLEPLLLTANHCLDGYFDAVSNPNLSKWIFYWDYEFPGCSDQINEPIIKSTVGATVIANNNISDFALFELTQDPRNLPSFVPYYLGWDRSGNSGIGGVGIHHPIGDVKKIATYSISPFDSYCANSNLYWDVRFISTANGHSVMQPGSSGSPLINVNRHIIGQL